MTTAWFVDGLFCLRAWNAVSLGARMDYGQLRLKIENDAGEQIDDAYYFNYESDPPSAAQDSFHNFLRSPPPRGPGMRIKLYPPQTLHHELPRPAGGGSQILHAKTEEQHPTKSPRSFGVGLTFNLMRSFYKKRWDKLYLIAGDGDLHEVIQHLVENEGVRATLIGTPGSVSLAIASYVRVWDLAQLKDAIERSSSSSPSSQQ